MWQSVQGGSQSFHKVGKSIEAAVEGAGFPVEDLRVMSEKAGVPMQAFATELVAMACERFKRDMEAEPNLEAVLVMRLEEQRQADQQAKAEAIKQKARIQQQLENMEQQRLQALEQARTESAKLAGQYYVSQYGPQPAPAPAPEGVMVKAIRNIERFFPPYRSVDKPGSDV
jgi:altronate dehydratase